MPTRRLPGSGPDPPASRVATETPVSVVATETPATSSNSSLDSGDIPSLHYYVFFGIIGTVFLTGAVLFYRASQLRRRRLREAAERARAGGVSGVAPHDRTELWGLGGLAAYTSDGRDRFGLPYPYPSSEGAGKGTEDRWHTVPELLETTSLSPVDGESLDNWDIQPLAVFTSAPIFKKSQSSLRSRSVESVHRVSPRDMGPRPRPPPIHIPLTLAPLRRSVSSRRRSISPQSGGHRDRRPSSGFSLTNPMDTAAMPFLSEESPNFEEGTVLHIAAIIRMPREDVEADVDSDVAWEPGMELCVWRGVVGQDDDYG